MTVLQLRATNVRCLQDVVLEPGRRNLIYGENASGKTSLLEAIFVLGRGRSFRSAQRHGIIKDGAARAMIGGSIEKNHRSVEMGLSIARDGETKVRVAGRDASNLAELAEWLPVQVLDPDLHRLVEEGPGVRRRFLDWGVFHVEHQFLESWRRYHRTLRQRNAALKRKQLPELDLWDDRLATEGEALQDYRAAYLASIQADINFYAEMLLDSSLVLEYRGGWTTGRPLREVLESTRERDLRFGATQVGPHRADIHIAIGDRKARGRVSRGQQKLLAASLVLGQLRHLEKACDVQSVLLLDDAAAELDRGRLDRLMTAVSTLGVQLFVTALHREDLRPEEDIAMFHVEQGRITPVV